MSASPESLPASASQTPTTGGGLDLRTIKICLLVFAGYYLGAKLGFAFTFHPRPISVLWPPNAILLAALLLTPTRTWWAVLLAAFPAHWLVQLQSEVPPRMVFCWFISNSFEALIGAGCTRYFINGPVRFDRLRNVGIFCFFGAFIGPILSSFLDSAFVVLNHWGEGSYWELLRIRTSSNVLAAMTIAPLIVTWASTKLAVLRKASFARLMEGVFLLLGLCTVNFVLFNEIPPGADPSLHYLPFPFLLWAAVRFGSPGATAVNWLFAFFAVWGAAHGHGPFSEKSTEENALSVQLSVIFTSLPLLFLGALIEERRNVEETLRERDERINLAAESANLALWAVNFERGESWMNEKGHALYCLAANEPLTREFFLSRVHPDDRQRIDETIERVRKSSQVFEAEYRLLLPDGETRWHIGRGRYLHNDRGQVSQLMGVSIDVTAQVSANLQLRRQRDEMARLSRVALMGELTASLAHELNQPLTAIASNAAAGKRNLLRGLDNRQMFEELLSDIVTDALRAGDVIHGIHRLVSKGDGKRSAVDLNSLILEVLRLLHSDFLNRATVVETQLAASLGAVEADPVHLQQVMLNLIVNSLEAMHETPAADRRITISTSAVDGFIEVGVRDRGVGLPKDDPDKVFSHFFSTKPNGMGMGLTIVRSIVEAHDGEIGAENLERGARVFFRLPVAQQAAPKSRL